MPARDARCDMIRIPCIPDIDFWDVLRNVAFLPQGRDSGAVFCGCIAKRPPVHCFLFENMVESVVRKIENRRPLMMAYAVGDPRVSAPTRYILLLLLIAAGGGDEAHESRQWVSVRSLAKGIRSAERELSNEQRLFFVRRRQGTREFRGKSVRHDLKALSQKALIHARLEGDLQYIALTNQGWAYVKDFRLPLEWEEQLQLFRTRLRFG